MSDGGGEAADGRAQGPAFSARAVLALVLVGIVAFAGMTVLAAYAPDLRAGSDGRAHALSRSAIGFAGAPVLMKSLGQPVIISRTKPRGPQDAGVVLTPDVGAEAKALVPLAGASRTLIILPKWDGTPDPLLRGYVRKAGLLPVGERAYSAMLARLSPATRVAHRKGEARPVLYGAGGPFASGTVLPLGSVDQLQTVSGAGWAPALTDETGAIVLAYARKDPRVLLLADPDLLNNQGLRQLGNARAGVAILRVVGGERPILFDVTLAGYERGKGFGKLFFEPPFLAATLCAVAAGLLMGAHALARFGLPRRRGRAFALGARALVDNAADLIKLARREHELAPAYVALMGSLVARGAGGGRELQDGWLEDLAARRGAASPAALAAEAETIKTREALLAFAAKLHDWRGEMMRERR